MFKTRRGKLTLTRSDVLDWQVAPQAAVELSQCAEIAVRASIKRADWSVPRGGQDRVQTPEAPQPGDAGSTVTRRTVQQSDAVSCADAPWLTVAHATHLVQAAAAPESLA